MDNPNPIFYKDLITPDNSITQLIEQLNALIATYDEMRGKVQGAATETAKAMNGLSGATEEQRKAILKNLEASDELVKEYNRVVNAELEAEKAKAQLNRANHEANQIAKLVVQYNASAEGSYNRLSAQYRLNKIALNEMSEAERKGTEYGRKLEQESKAIYEEMNRLQKATGKAQLQVGQYERALGSALGVNSKFVDILMDSNKASEAFHSIINALKTPIGAVIGVVGAAVAAFKLFKESVHETQTSGDSLDREMAGWRNTWDLFRKAVASVDFTMFIRNAAEATRAGTELQMVLDQMFERTSSTRLLKAAMSQENAMLEETMRNTALSYEERLAAGEQYLANMQPIYQQEEESAKRVRDAQLENLFALTRTREYASEAEREAAKQEFADNIKNYNLNEELFKQALEYNLAIKNRETLYKNVQAADPNVYKSLEKRKAAMDAIVAGASEDVKAFAGFVEQYQLTSDAQVKAYVDAQVAYNEAQAAAYNDQKRIVNSLNSIRANVEKDRQDAAKASAKAAEDARKASEKEEQERIKAEAQAAAERERIRKEEIAEQKAYMQAQLQSLQLSLAVTDKWSEQYITIQIAAIQKQREIALFENAQLAEKLRQDEAAINAKYDNDILIAQTEFNTKLAERDLAAAQDLAQAEFDLLDRNERQKTIFRLQQEKARLEAVLKLNETATNKMTETEIAAIKATIEGIEKEIGQTGYKNIYELLGLNVSSQQQTALNTAIDSVKDNITSLVDSWNNVAAAAVNAANAQVDAAQRALDAEIEARNAGYANEVDTAQKELALARQNQQQAIREQQKAQRAQAAIDSLTQSSSLMTASANIWKSLSGIPVVGPGLAAAALATMWVSFAAAKIKAVQVSKSEQYAEGTVELLQGGSHASGHDIDLGTKPDGTRRRAEGGEFFAVINKRNSRRYRNIIPDVINSFNDGTFADRYQKANAMMAGYAVNMIGGAKTDVSGLEKDVAAIRKQGDQSRFVDGQGNTVIHYKNLTRKIKN